MHNEMRDAERTQGDQEGGPCNEVGQKREGGEKEGRRESKEGRIGRRKKEEARKRQNGRSNIYPYGVKDKGRNNEEKQRRK